MKVRVNREKCYLSGECYYNHPELFRMDEEGYPVILVDEINNDEMERHAREAVEVCPAVAISLED